MCRNCPLPQWSEPIEVEVSALPAYFAKEQSWNFERLNFGNGTVIDTKDGKSARPSVTGLVGTRLRDGFALKPHPRFPGGRYLLVSECLYCPGRRYGCTPRENCTGKRRFCCALCKISIFADKPDHAFIYYSGTHGTGDVSALDRHRPNKHMLDELRRLRVEEGLTPSQGYEWCKSYFNEHDLDDKQMPTKQQIKSLMKRASKLSRMRETKTGVKSLSSATSPAISSVVTTPQQSNEGMNVTLMKYSQLIGLAENGELPAEAGSSTYLSDGAATNVSSSYSPGSTPVGVSSRMSVTSLLNSPLALNSSNNSSADRGTNGYRASMETEKDSNPDKLKEFVRILQEENFNRISQIADLQVEVNILKNQVLELKEDNLKKAIHIAQLERERRAAQYLSSENSTENTEQSQSSSQETNPETLVENSEESVVIENSVATPMDTEVCDPRDQPNTASFEESVCETPMAVSIQTSSLPPEGVCETPIAVSIQTSSPPPEAVCETSIAVSIQTSSPPPMSEAVSQSVPTTLDNPVIVAQAIIVSQAATEEEMA